MRKIFLICLLLSGIGMNGFAQEKPKEDVETPELLAGQRSVEKANDLVCKTSVDCRLQLPAFDRSQTKMSAQCCGD